MNLQSSWEDRTNKIESENKLRAILDGANFQSTVLCSEMFQSLWTGVAKHYYFRNITARPRLKCENISRKKEVSKMS